MLEKFEQFEIGKKDKNKVLGGTQSNQSGTSGFIQSKKRTSINGNTEPIFIIDGDLIDIDE